MESAISDSDVAEWNRKDDEEITNLLSNSFDKNDIKSSLIKNE